MKKTVLMFVIVLMGLVLAAGNASAWYFELNNSDATGPDDLTFDIVFNPEGTVRLDNYRLDFRYDTTELANWTSGGGSFTNTPPSPLFQMFGPLEEEDANGYTPGFLWNLNAAVFGDGPDVSSEITVGTITFGSLLPGASQDEQLDLWFNEQPLMTATIGGTSHDLSHGSGTLKYGSGMDVPVPIPGTVLLFGSGLLGLLGIGRRRRNT